MEKIKAIKEKFDMPGEEEFFHEFDTYFHCAEDKLNKHGEHLLALEIKLQEMKSKVETAEEAVSLEKQLLTSKLLELNTCETQVDEFKVEKNQLIQEIQQMSIHRNSMKNSKPSIKDQQVLTQGLKKLKYYKQLTGVRWDFEAPQEIVKGYVSNGVDHIHSFKYNIQEVGSKLQNLLWNDIAKATKQQGLAENDENRSPNV